jgi:antitoxin component YwqK of YwqJK toxin-antitoxin module
MKTLLIVILSLSFSISVIGQNSHLYQHWVGQNKDRGGCFPNFDAKNLTINGLKEGKWIEIIENNTVVRCIEYKAGKPDGIVSDYGLGSDTCTLSDEIPYTDGKINGIRKDYDCEGLHKETPYLDDKINGIVKEYFDTVVEYLDKHNFHNLIHHRYKTIKQESSYINNKLDGLTKKYSENETLEEEDYYVRGNLKDEKDYDENGLLKSETDYTHNSMGITTKYDKNGNEIK